MRVLDDRWRWCWNLAGFLSRAWPYSNANDGVSYAPWDARRILQWGKAERDENGQKPIAMCVHYAVCFVQFCAAMKIPARAVVLTPDLNLPAGHFVAEVWLDEFESWAMIDPNLHLYFQDASTLRPLAVGELWSRREELSSLAVFGEGWQTHRARFENWLREYYLSGAGYRLWGVWARHDWIENPHCAPPAHGAVPYAETDILWCAGDEFVKDEFVKNELAMFPHFLTARQLAART